MKPDPARSASGEMEHTRSERRIAARGESIGAVDKWQLAWTAVSIGLLVCALLWLINIPYRRAYQPNDNDVTALADALLLLPGAQWQDWFTQGHTHFFDAYPEWPWGLTPFARPAFQFLIYLAHFLFGRDWTSYLAINYAAIGAVAGVAFAIARKALGLANGPALVASALVAVSPAVLEYSIWEVGFASESLIVALIGGAFLAVLSRRDFLCLVLLSIAIFNKETAVWAPFAASMTILLRQKRGEAPRHRVLAAALMLAPVGLWFGYRYLTFGGVGGSYATGGYTHLSDVFAIVSDKLLHLFRLFTSQHAFISEGPWASPDRLVALGTYALVLLLLVAWAAGWLRSGWQWIGASAQAREWPEAGAGLLVAIWGTMGLAFHLAVPLTSPRYAAAAILFLWPSIVAAVASRGKVLRLALVICLVFSVARMSDFLASLNPPPGGSYLGQFFRSIAAVNHALAAVPPGIRQIYVVPGGGLVTATPDYLRVFLGVEPEIIRVIDLHWYCRQGESFAGFSHEFADGVVTLSAKLPDCADFFFDMAGARASLIADGRLRRSDSISYELPEAHVIDHKGPVAPALEPGHEFVARIHTSGPARFIIEGPGGTISWFDTP
jgi:hypothetical protein